MRRAGRKDAYPEGNLIMFSKTSEFIVFMSAVQRPPASLPHWYVNHTVKQVDNLMVYYYDFSLFSGTTVQLHPPDSKTPATVNQIHDSFTKCIFRHAKRRSSTAMKRAERENAHPFADIMDSNIE